MKIILLTDGIWPYALGGMQKHSYYLVRHLAQRKIQVTVFMPASSGTMADEFPFPEEAAQYISLVEIPRPRPFSFPGYYLWEEYQYARAVLQRFWERANRPDLVYIQGFSGWALLRQRKRYALNIPTVINFHGLEMFQKSADLKSSLINQYFRPFVRRNLHLADYVQSLGGQLTSMIKAQGIPAEHILPVGIGIEEDWLVEEISEPAKVRTFVFLGRNERRKGIKELAMALSSLIDQQVDFAMHFIGPIDETEQLADDRIYYHGLVKDTAFIKEQLVAADVLVCPSYAEGMPTVILEAMASGCAIIATDVGAVCEQVDGENGWLIPPGDVRALQSAMQAAIDVAPDRLVSLQEASLRRVKERFLWSQVIDEMLMHFERIAVKQ